MTTKFPNISGYIQNGSHYLPLRIYWEDTDGGGIVYHANYLKFMERGRSDFLRLLGIHQLQFLQATGVSIVVGRMQLAFKRSAQLDDLIHVQTCLLTMGGATIVLKQTVWRDNVLLLEAEVTVASIKEGKPVRIPDVLRNAFSNSLSRVIC